MKKVELELTSGLEWLQPEKCPVFIAGPCSAETEQQVLEDAHGIAALQKVAIFRSGIWKPRTRPNAFEGQGERALQWLQRVKSETGLRTTVEVANAEHAELALKYNIDILWIGARTTVNPFSVQEVADVLKGVDIPVMIKNPINPDLNLWIGALERLNRAGITKLAAIHRGFSNYESTKFRNSPRWELPIQLMASCPGLPIISDPSHISGRRELIEEVSQKALDLGMHGLMIETHPDPEHAWSDADQQITPQELGELIKRLTIREASSLDPSFNNHLAQLRRIIDSIDEELLQIIAKRLKVIEQIGEYKRENNVTIFQPERWNEILDTRTLLGKNLELDPPFIHRILQELHRESIQKQTEIMFGSFAIK